MILLVIGQFSDKILVFFVNRISNIYTVVIQLTMLS